MKKFAGAIASVALIWMVGTAAASPVAPSVSITENAQYQGSNFNAGPTLTLQVTVSCPAGDILTVRGTVTQRLSNGFPESGNGENFEFCSGGTDRLFLDIRGGFGWAPGTAFAEVTACDF